MSKKKNILAVLETHVDKIILGPIGLISLYLLWMFLITNPYAVEVQGKKFGPGQIDQYNRQQARMIEEALNRPAEPIAYDLRITAEFEELFHNSLPKLAIDLPIPYPGVGEKVIVEDRIYPVPDVVPPADVRLAWVRGAAHLPTEEVTPDMPYQAVPTELGDLDFVSVSARIDVQTLYRNFQQSFVGPRLNVAWREPAFARPVFARVELQRRQVLEDGSWSSWTTLPRPRTDAFRKLIESTPLTTEEMEFGGVMMWIKQYEDPRVQISLLQPPPYDFASLAIPWMPPKYFDEAQEILKRQEEERRRRLREERLRARSERDDTGSQTVRGRDMLPQGGRMTEIPQPAPTIRTTAQRRERTLDDIRREMQQDFIDEKTRLDNLRDPLLIWAHDDTAQPGQTYQYRIRFGVFNPIAGRDWFSEDQKHYKNQVVLWSDFGEPTPQLVSIPKMMHLFPLDVFAKDEGGVKVDVARYYLGQWRTNEFDVFPGQIIGKKVEYTPSTAAAAAVPMAMPEMMGGRGGGFAAGSQPLSVDFSTPYLFVDVNTLIQWRGTSRQEFYQMLCYGPEESLLGFPIGTRYWSADMSREYREIKDAEQNAMPLNLSRSTMPGQMMPRDAGRMMPRDAGRMMPGDIDRMMPGS
ncbi:MAG: hypothetical protein GX298_00960 [Planctomycetes bacterium]|nr:hypothetical protein [Planctomycetota bacterium]